MKEVSMRRLNVLVVALLGVVPLLLHAQVGFLTLEARPDAAHARLGTWKLNLQNSRIDPASPATYKSETRIYTDAGAQGMTQGVKASITTVDADSKMATRSFTAKYDGKDYPQTGNPNGDTISIKEIDPYTADAITKKAGKVVLNTHSVLSKDGQVLTMTSTGTNSKGQRYTNTLVFDKQ
jgi:hypothetical protein